MRNKYIYKSSAILLSVFLLSTPINNIAFATETQSQSPPTDVLISDTQFTTISDLKLALEKAEMTRLAKDIRDVINVLSRLQQGYKNPEYISIRDNNIESFITLINEMPEDEEKLFIKDNMAAILVNISEQTLSVIDYSIAYEFVLSLPKGDVRTLLNAKLEYISDKIIEIMKAGNYFDTGAIPSEWLDELDYEKDFKNPNEGWIDDGYIPGYSKPTLIPTPKITNNVEFESTFYYEKNEFVIEGGKCYKITKHFDYTNKEINSTKQLAKGIEISFCPIESKISENNSINNLSNHVQNGYNQGGYNQGENNQSINNQNGQSNQNNPPTSEGEFYSEAEKDSQLTLQYTLNKNALSPKYTDTGIRVSLKNTITYLQAKDSMHQLAIMSGGKFVEDKNKFLILVEGRILVIRYKQEIEVNELEKFFDNLNVEIKALNTKIGSNDTVQDFIQLNGINHISINGETVILENELILENSKIMFPLVQLSELLEGEVIVENHKVTIKYKDKNFVFEKDKNTMFINDKSVELEVSTRIKSNGVLYGDVRKMLNYLDYQLIWDSQNFKLLINQK